MGRLGQIGYEGEWDSTSKKWIVCLVFHFLYLARFYSCIILIVLSYVILLHRNIVFLKFEHDQVITYVRSFFSYFEHLGYLT